MSSSDKRPEYDYIIHDAKGSRKVIDGKEYPLEEKDLPKDHRDTGCTECSYVADANIIRMFPEVRALRESVGIEPVFVGKFTMPKWSGHSSFYLFQCASCAELSVDYPHGYHGEFVYVRCRSCGERFDFSSPDHREVYK